MNKYNLLHLNKIDSTNKYLKDNYRNLPEYTLVYADIQTNGRGRMNRVWESSSDNIEMSLLLKPSREDAYKISLVVGVAVLKTLEMYLQPSIKWPNDIMVNDKKICGILLEGISTNKIEAIVVGVGINVNQKTFDSSINNKATSLTLELGKTFDKEEIINNFISNFDTYYQLYLNNDNSYINIIRENFYLKNKEGIINNKKVKVIDIDDEGSLVVLYNGKEEKINYGEVNLQSFYK